MCVSVHVCMHVRVRMCTVLYESNMIRRVSYTLEHFLQQYELLSIAEQAKRNSSNGSNNNNIHIILMLEIRGFACVLMLQYTYSLIQTNGRIRCLCRLHIVQYARV